MTTAIPYARESWSVVTGCSMHCPWCWARAMARRAAHGGDGEGKAEGLMSERVLESFEVDTPRARREFPCCGDRRRRFVLHKRRPTMCMDPDYEIAECLSCGATLTTGDNAGQEEMARLRVAWERSCGEWTLKRWPVVSQDGEELTP